MAHLNAGDEGFSLFACAGKEVDDRANLELLQIMGQHGPADGYLVIASSGMHCSALQAKQRSRAIPKQWHILDHAPFTGYIRELVVFLREPRPQ